MRLDDRIELQKRVVTYNETLDASEKVSWITLGKCVIVQNSSAKKIKGNDGELYTYSYIVYLKKPKDVHDIPRENDMVHIVKKDGTIDVKIKVAGFRTLRNWLELWL